MKLNFNTNFILCFHSLEKLADETLNECKIDFFSGYPLVISSQSMIFSVQNYSILFLQIINQKMGLNMSRYKQ